MCQYVPGFPGSGSTRGDERCPSQASPAWLHRLVTTTALPPTLPALAQPSAGPVLGRKNDRPGGRTVAGFTTCQLAGAINLARMPEYLSEDPLLSAAMAGTSGFGNGVIATTKHFSLNCKAETNRHWLDAVIDPDARVGLLAFEDRHRAVAARHGGVLARSAECAPGSDHWQRRAELAGIPRLGDVGLGRNAAGVRWPAWTKSAVRRSMRLTAVGSIHRPPACRRRRAAVYRRPVGHGTARSCGRCLPSESTDGNQRRRRTWCTQRIATDGAAGIVLLQARLLPLGEAGSRVA